MSATPPKTDAAGRAADDTRERNAIPHRLIITRVVKERGVATILVPEGEDPNAVLDQMREDGDDFLAWDTLNISDLSVDITPAKEEN